MKVLTLHWSLYECSIDVDQPNQIEEIRGDLTQTDLHVYAMDGEYGLVKADRMARSLSPQIAR